VSVLIDKFSNDLVWGKGAQRSPAELTGAAHPVSVQLFRRGPESCLLLRECQACLLCLATLLCAWQQSRLQLTVHTSAGADGRKPSPVLQYFSYAVATWPSCRWTAVIMGATAGFMLAYQNSCGRLMGLKVRF